VAEVLRTVDSIGLAARPLDDEQRHGAEPVSATSKGFTVASLRGAGRRSACPARWRKLTDTVVAPAGPTTVLGADAIVNIAAPGP
jgi:hypothetical protein